MGIELELNEAISSTEQLIDQVQRAYGETMHVNLAEDSVHRARNVLGTDDEPAMQHAWLDVTVAQTSLHAQMHGRCRKAYGLPGVSPASIKAEMDASLASTRNALRQIFARPGLLDALPELGAASDAVNALAGMAVEVAANDVDSAAAWIYTCQDRIVAAANAKADAEASASANSASAGSKNRKL